MRVPGTVNTVSQLEQTLFRLGAILVVSAVLLAALPSIPIPEVGAEPLLVLLALGLLWIVGRVAWARRGTSRPEMRPKPRRRALPPPPRLGDNDHDYPEHR